MNIGSVFENNRTQAVRLPMDTRFDSNVKRVSVRVVGKSRIIEPLHQDWDSFFHPEQEAVTEDFLNERASQFQVERESFDA
jgi:antitoxin VapB